MFKSPLSPCSLKVPFRDAFRESGLYLPVAFRDSAFFKILMKRVNHAEKQLGKQSNRLPELNLMIYPKCGFRFPSGIPMYRKAYRKSSRVASQRERERKRADLPGCLPVSPCFAAFASGCLPGCGVFWCVKT